MVLAVCVGLAVAPAARATVIDGISDQGLPRWDGGFSSSSFAWRLRQAWVGEGRIRYARYVLQWNAFADRVEEPYARYAAEFERWWEDVKSLTLTPVVAFYNYCPQNRAGRGCAKALGSPRNEAEYRAAIEGVLARYRAPIVEAWNEPNDDDLSASEAARFMNAALALCTGEGCTAIAGDFLDSPGAAKYATEYVRSLNVSSAPLMTNWGLHPYHAVNGRQQGEAEAIRAELRGRARQVWITEIGAYYCDGGEIVGERGQRARARRLVDEVAPRLEAAHTFYYEFLRGNDAAAPCESGGRQQDSALYRPDDEARAAAEVIFHASARAPVEWSGLAEALA